MLLRQITHAKRVVKCFWLNVLGKSRQMLNQLLNLLQVATKLRSGSEKKPGYCKIGFL